MSVKPCAVSSPSENARCAKVEGVDRQPPAAARLQPRDLCGMQAQGGQSFLFIFFKETGNL